MVGRQNAYIHLQWAAVLFTLRTTALDRYKILRFFTKWRIAHLANKKNTIIMILDFFQSKVFKLKVLSSNNLNLLKFKS